MISKKVWLNASTLRGKYINMRQVISWDKEQKEEKNGRETPRAHVYV